MLGLWLNHDSLLTIAGNGEDPLVGILTLL